MKSRKRLGIIITCLMIAFTTAQVAHPQERSQAPQRTMAGSWKVIITPGLAPLPLPATIESIVTYIPGGGLVESDNLAIPGSIAGSGQGAWEFIGAQQFRLTFTKYLFSTQGQSLGSVRVTETISLAPGDNEYAGEGTMEILNPAGALILAIPLTTNAVRIRVEEP